MCNTLLSLSFVATDMKILCPHKQFVVTFMLCVYPYSRSLICSTAGDYFSHERTRFLHHQGVSCHVVQSPLRLLTKNHSSSFSYLLFLMFDSNVLDIFMGKISSQVTKQKERCKHNFVFSLAHSFYQISFQFLFIQKYIRYFLITFLQISLLQVKSNLQKFHRQNILVHA